jgi:hypothetical protein
MGELLKDKKAIGGNAIVSIIENKNQVNKIIRFRNLKPGQNCRKDDNYRC